VTPEAHRRAPALAGALLATTAALALGACAAAERFDMVEFRPQGERAFTFLARASFGRSAGAGGSAEAERLDWIRDELAAHGMCSDGWILMERTPLRRGRTAFLGYPDYDILYRGMCAGPATGLTAQVGAGAPRRGLGVAAPPAPPPDAPSVGGETR
jgi:hypothetical protein